MDDIVVSELYEGSGHVHCQHGMMPVPVPATANIVAANHLPMKITDAQGEMVTPTGAAIAAALRTQDHLPEDYQLLKIGLGAGKKDFPKANVLRAMLLETKDQPQTGEEEDIWKLESNIDDCSGEVLGYTMELSFGCRGERCMLCADLHEEESSGLYASCAVLTADRFLQWKKLFLMRRQPSVFADIRLSVQF